MNKGAYTIYLVADTAKFEGGLWCDHCMLPSGWRVPLLTLSLTGVGKFGTIACCGECDRPVNAT